MPNSQIGPALSAGGIVLSDIDIEVPGCEQLPLANGIQAGRYFAVRSTVG